MSIVQKRPGGLPLPGLAAEVSNISADEELIDLVYASLLGETSWQQFLDRLSETLPGGRSVLFFHDNMKKGGTFELSSGLDGGLISEYNSYYSRRNPWMAKAAVREIGRGVTADEMLPHAELVKTEFYNDFLLRAECRSAVGVTIMREEGVSFLLSTLTCRQDANENQSGASRLARLAPHLARAFRHYRHGPSRDPAIEIGGSLFDAIDVALVIAGEGSVIKTASSFGQTLLESGTCIRLSAFGRLKICAQEADAAFREMLERGYSGPKVLRFLVKDTRLTLIRVEKDRYSFYFEGPTVVLLAEPVGAQARTVSIEDFARTYMLTPAERRSLAGLVSGRTIDEIAAAANLSRETIRTQMKSVYAKTGARTQVELLRLAARIGTASDNSVV